MPVRLRITFLFTVVVMIILAVVCGGIYYFSYKVRINNIDRRLTNRAITTARLLAQKESFDRDLVQKIDSLTTIALKDKTVQAYDYQNNKIYSYSDLIGDTLYIDENILDNARVNGSKFFQVGDKEAVAYHYTDDKARIVVVSAAEDVDGKRSLHSLLRILLWSFFAGSIFVLVTGYIFSTRLLLPIKKIAADVEEISAQNLARRIKTSASKDEWTKLADTLNNLLNHLQESFEFQKRFISNASHELSTPLTSISSQLEIILQRERNTGDYKRVLESVYQDVRHMRKLTQTLLEFAKASGTAGGLEIAMVRIDEIILRLPAEMAAINKQFRVSIDFEQLPVDEERLVVLGNEILLLMAIKNIVLNACKYSGDHHASVLLKTDHVNLGIIVSDNGPGIPSNEMENIFQPFYRVRQHSDNTGFGLGLSLASRIITMHKGSIEVLSEIGKGSEFRIYLPVVDDNSKTV